jgi:hypothetical protein
VRAWASRYAPAFLAARLEGGGCVEIIAFQIFIVLSMAVARVFSPKALGIAAVGWSIFTLIMVFATPLILLQLFVIWGSHSLFAPKQPVTVSVNQRPKKSEQTVGSKNAQRPPPSFIAQKAPDRTGPIAQSAIKQPEPLRPIQGTRVPHGYNLFDVDQPPNSIAASVATKKIPYLVHFTKVENIPSIMKHGLLSVEALQSAELSFLRNDQVRLDRRADACCLSIAHPNERLFYHWRMRDPGSDWVVLVLARELLWEKDVAFCAHNAADARMSAKDIDERRSLSAFEAMFVEHETTPHRDLQGLHSFDPSDVQAEVLAFEKITPDSIIGAAFSNSAAARKFMGHFGSRRVRHVPEGEGFFGTRTSARRAGWEF